MHIQYDVAQISTANIVRPKGSDRLQYSDGDCNSPLWSREKINEDESVVETYSPRAPLPVLLLKPPPMVPASHVPATPLLIPLPANADGKAVEDCPHPWAPASTCKPGGRALPIGARLSGDGVSRRRSVLPSSSPSLPLYAPPSFSLSSLALSPSLTFKQVKNVIKQMEQAYDENTYSCQQMQVF